MKKTVDIFDLLGPEAAKPIDDLGYSFLKSQGYNVTGAAKSHKRRARLKDALEKRGETLYHRGAIDEECGSILVWFELYRGDTRIAKSIGIKFMQKERENVGDGREDKEGQERPQKNTGVRA